MKILVLMISYNSITTILITMFVEFCCWFWLIQVKNWLENFCRVGGRHLISARGGFKPVQLLLKLCSWREVKLWLDCSKSVDFSTLKQVSMCTLRGVVLSYLRLRWSGSELIRYLRSWCKWVDRYDQMSPTLINQLFLPAMCRLMYKLTSSSSPPPRPSSSF